MKVENMTSSSGNQVANQFIITAPEGRYFQSYSTMIVYIPNSNGAGSEIAWTHNKVHLDRNGWNYSKTTSKYRNLFLGETTKETKAKIKSGEYILTALH